MQFSELTPPPTSGTMTFNMLPLIILLVTLTIYIVFVTWKNYTKISTEHAMVKFMAWFIARCLDISTIAMAIYWRIQIYTAALNYGIEYGFYYVVLAFGDFWVPVLGIYLVMFIPKAFLALIVSRHRKQSGRGSALQRLTDTTIFY